MGSFSKPLLKQKAVFIMLFSGISFVSCNIQEEKQPKTLKSKKENGSISEEVEIKQVNQKSHIVATNDTTIDTPYLAERLAPIKRNFLRINRINEWALIKERTLHQTAEGGKATYYFQEDTLLKLMALHYGETGIKKQEFYVDKGQLSFVFEQTINYNRSISWDTISNKEFIDSEVNVVEKLDTIEDRSYFENGKLIRLLNSQDCGAPFAKEFLLQEESRLKKEFQALQKLL